MNFLKIANGELISKSVGNQYCSKFIEHKKCSNFLANNSFCNGIKKCPYGFTSIFNNELICCGFIIDEYADKNLIRDHIKNSKHKAKIITIPSGGLEIINQFLLKFYSFAIYSQTKHELINFIGHLKTLLELCHDHDEKEKQLLNEFEKIVVIYAGFDSKISKYDDFIRNIIKNDDGFCLIYNNSSNLKIFSEIVELYQEFIDTVYTQCKSIKSLIGKPYEYEETFESKRYLLSLVFLNDLFINRIKYQQMALGLSNENSNTTINYNWNKVATKYSKIMEYSARKKKTYFNFVGYTYDSFKAKKDLFLAIYILFENAIKYTKMERQIDVAFADSEDYCEMVISNDCDTLTKVSKEEFCKKGYRGSNSSISNSNGLGLFLVEQIFRNNNIDFDIDVIGQQRFVVKIHAPKREK